MIQFVRPPSFHSIKMHLQPLKKNSISNVNHPVNLRMANISKTMGDAQVLTEVGQLEAAKMLIIISDNGSR